VAKWFERESLAQLTSSELQRTGLILLPELIFRGWSSYLNRLQSFPLKTHSSSLESEAVGRASPGHGVAVAPFTTNLLRR